jgi:hypothetical protein
VALFMVGGAVLWWLIPRLQGRSVLTLVLVPGLVQGLVVGAAAWPIAWALRADVAQSVRWLAAAATLGLAAAMVWLVTLAVARPVETAAPAVTSEPARRPGMSAPAAQPRALA